MASAAVVLAVGTRLRGHASSATLQSSATSAAWASVDVGAAGDRHQLGAQPANGFEQPEDLVRFAAVRQRHDDIVALDDAEIAVDRFGRDGGKNDGVPMLVSVAAILRQMMPDLPMPVRMTRPWHSRRSWTARSKRSSSRSTARGSRRPPSRAPFARARNHPWIVRRTSASLRDRVDGHQPPQQRLQPIQVKRVLGVAFGARAGRRAPRETLRRPRRRRRPIPAARCIRPGPPSPRRRRPGAAGCASRRTRPGTPWRAHDRKGAHVDDEVVVAEARAAFRHDDARVARGHAFATACRMSSGARNWPFLMFTMRPVCRGGGDEIGLAREERRESAARRRPRQPDAPATVRERRSGSGRRYFDLMPARMRSPSSSPGPRNERAGRPVGLVVRRLEDERHAEPAASIVVRRPASSVAWASLSMTHGPAMRTSGRPPPMAKSPIVTGFTGSIIDICGVRLQAGQSG